jgi:hypothetical protein
MQVYKARDVGVNSFVLFPKVPDALKVMLMYITNFLFVFVLVWLTLFFLSSLQQEMKHTMIMVWFHAQSACLKTSSLIL